MNYVDLFDLMGIKPEEPKKEEVKKKSKTANKNKAEETITLPATVYTGYNEPIILNESNFDGKNKVSLNDAHVYLSTVYPDYPVEISVLQKGKENVLYLVHKDVYKVEKATLHFNKDTLVLVAGSSLDVSPLKTAEECDIESKDLEKLFSNAFPEYGKVGFIHSAIANIIVPTFNFPRLTKEVEFPVRVGVFGRADIVILKEDYLNYMNKETADDNKNSKNEKTNNSDKVVLKANSEFIEHMVVSIYPDFAEGHLELQWNEKDKIIIAKMAEKQLYKPPAPKIVEYPTNATLSLLYTRIELSPEMFEGKEKVEGEELRKYIAKDRPEYSKELTDITYDKKHNLITMVRRGGKKGVDIILDVDTAMNKIKLNKHMLFDWYNDGYLFRVEQADAFRIIAPKSNPLKGSFQMILPKVPISYFYDAKMLFQNIYVNYKTEATMQLFYNKENKKYFWHIPKQVAGYDWCEIERDIDIEMRNLLVGEFHSHGKYEAYFSNVDDRDELGYRIYGVFGSFDKDDVTFCMRAGTGGCFVPLKIEDVFVDNNAYHDPDNLKELYYKARANIEFIC